MIKKTLLSFLVLIPLTSTPVALAESTPSEDISVPQSRGQIHLSFAPIVKKIAPAVVNIYTKRTVTRSVSPFMNDPFFSQFFGSGNGFGFPQQRLEGSLGSGVIVNPDGLVVTNAHVIQDADEVTVALNDGREFPSKILLQDEASDLALLQIERETEKDPLPSAQLEPSEGLEVGDLVLAIGNPFGVGQTVTSGIVSALARSSLNINDFNFFIQTDAAINPGNSGGPLVSMSGQIVGINSAIYSKDGGSLGIGFAIPSEMVATLLAAQKSGQVTKGGQIIRPWLGVSVQDVTRDLASSLSLKIPTGALISSLHPASPALKSGLKQGDVVTAVNGHPIHDAAEMHFRLAMVPLGETANLSYIREGKTGTSSLTSIAPPDTPARQAVRISGQNPLQGATLVNINPAVEVELGLKNPPEKGVVIAAIARNGIVGGFANIGDIVLEINGLRITSPQQAAEILEQPAQNGWIIKLNSGGQGRTVAIH